MGSDSHLPRGASHDFHKLQRQAGEDVDDFLDEKTRPYLHEQYAYKRSAVPCNFCFSFVGVVLIAFFCYLWMNGIMQINFARSKAEVAPQMAELCIAVDKGEVLKIKPFSLSSDELTSFVRSIGNYALSLTENLAGNITSEVN